MPKKEREETKNGGRKELLRSIRSPELISPNDRVRSDGAGLKARV